LHTYTQPFHSRLTGQPAPSVENWRILLEQSLRACVSLLLATNAFILERRC